MLPNNYFYQVQIKHQEFEREIRQQALAKLSFTGHDHQKRNSHDLMVRFGGWLIRKGEYLETRYSQCMEACVPARTASAR